MQISKLHHLTQDLPGVSHAEQAEKACQGGVDWIQLRVKGAHFKEWLKIAGEVSEVCDQYNSRLIINDSVVIAKCVEADGIHIGKHDISPVEARDILGNKYIIGGTANTMDDILELVAQGVDYIGLGPYKFTTTKDTLNPILGLEGYLEIMKSCTRNDVKTPVIAIGGITINDINNLLKTGIYGVAVSSAINSANDITEAAREFAQHLLINEE